MGIIRNGLERALNFGRAAVVSLPLLLGTYGCEPDEPIVNPTKANMEINPKSGKHPLISTIKLDGTGDKELQKYLLTIDGKKIRDANYPLDTLITFRNYNYTKEDIKKTIIGEVIDSEGNSSKDYWNITIYPRGVNPFVQPNDSTLNWYGSGDVDGNNTINWEDYNAMNTTSNDKSDLDGDGVPSTSNDKKILNDYLTGILPYLPGYWNELRTRAEREDWFKKMLKIDKTNEIRYSPDFDCDQHVYQAMMNFGGFDSEGLKKFKEMTPQYDTTKNCRYNIPVEFVRISFYDVNNKPLGSHAVGGVIFGDERDIEEMCMFETFNDSMYVNIGKDYIPSDHQRVWIHGCPVVSGLNQDGTKYVELTAT